MTYSANSIPCTDLQQIDTAYSNQLNTAYRSPVRIAEPNLDSVFSYQYFLPLRTNHADILALVSGPKENAKFEIGDKFLKILQDNSFNETDGGDVIDHISKVLEILEWIKIPNMDQNQLRLHVFPISLSEDAREWWNNEIERTVTTWKELAEKFFLKYYPLSHTSNNKIPDDLNNGSDYLGFLNWLGSNFKKPLEHG
ncbi:hypothetical protein Tco_0988132 [Tanacetum coccineum]|uniref:Retrotransposon gag domain-containing protein n=1 Tax=Tanacetum coccineum TaxID=301880 RepID=A0ABQ5EQI8_9ASTR